MSQKLWETATVSLVQRYSLYATEKIPISPQPGIKLARPHQVGQQQQNFRVKKLSYNNLVDLEAARRIITEFDPSEPAAAVLKHTNPCGAAVGSTLAEAYEKAFNADNISAFGGIVALNQTIDAATAEALTKTFLECVVAPDVRSRSPRDFTG